jgi:hypothetical protein
MMRRESMQADRYATVLVAVLKSPRDLELALNERWYRIPEEHFPPRAAAARYIAFYQPAGAFAAEGGVVRYVAPILCWEILRRRDLLPDEADHPRADELYFKVTLGDLERLVPPIRAGRWKRFAFIVTHWERLHEAEEISDLLHGSVWQESLWNALRKAGVL